MDTQLFFARARQVSELDDIAGNILTLFPTDRIFAIYGNMGVGKTTLIKAFCRKLGVPDIVNSPTFSIVNEYRTIGGERIYHFDFYRIKKLEEVYDLGYEDYLFSGSYCFIEWPEKLDSLIPAGCVEVHMEDHSGARIIRV